MKLVVSSRLKNNHHDHRTNNIPDLESSTAMFGRLAETNAMAQIMYGLALRFVSLSLPPSSPSVLIKPVAYSHGWGIPPNPPLAIHYLSLAASSAASVESAALSSGLKKGGAAKGELVLAIYELANSYRHGWGVEKDMMAAKSYYECAANMGDTDAMNEVAKCYEEGEGGKKDRVSLIFFLYIWAKGKRLRKEEIGGISFVCGTLGSS